MSENFNDIFELLDGNKDNLVTLQELGNTIKLLNPKVRQQDIDDIEKEFASDIDINLFNSLWKSKLKESNNKIEDEYQTLFDYFDKDKNGLIDAKDLIDGFSSFGADINPEEADEMIIEADLDGDRFLDAEEFQRIIKSFY